MIMKNQMRLNELQSDFKEVSKIAGEPVVNVRKIKGMVKNVKGKRLKIKQQESTLKELGADDEEETTN